MTPERYQQVKQIYQQAVDRPLAERADWLVAVCGLDEALRTEVEMLLGESAETAPLLETPPPLPDFPPLPKRIAADQLIGQRIGPYKILREIGQGGMGAVYLAERADEQFRKRAALKVVKRGMDTEEILSRFRHERQILASLDHPNIARLLDGGTTEDGLPYFVMEFIEGQPIDLFCSTHKLSTNERLKLFRVVCSAVHYAHQNLVVHRDLKPSNILVTADGTVKLLDFGIAKILNPDLFPDAVLPTKTWERPMTPAYASPEQVRGHAITTASDVYSLGVILYELLSGQRPYQFKGYAPHEIAKVVCETEPDKPSTAVVRMSSVDRTTPNAEGDKLSKQLKGDLDNIVLMALRKEPQRRYASVEQFSEDIRRHLDGLPVIAREDTFRYRTGKFIARNRLAVAAAAVFALLLAGFLATTLLQSARIRHERDAAKIERDKAEKVTAFLVEVFKVNDPSEAKGNAVTARELLDKGAQKATAELKDQPAVQAKLLDTIGMVYNGLGLYQQSAPLIEQALATRQQLYGPQHAEVAESLRNLAEVKFNQGEFDVAAVKTRAALDILRRSYGNDHLKVAQALSDLGLTLLFKGDAVGAEPFAREAVEILRKLPQVPAEVRLQTVANYANVVRQNRKFAEATQAQEEALALSRQTHGDDHLNTIVTLGGLALLLSDGDNPAKDYARAEQCSREALERGRRILPAEHPQTIFNLIDLGGILLKQNNLAAAETTLYEAYALAQKVLPAGHFRRTHAQHMLGRCYAEQRRFAEAELLLLGSWQTFTRLRGPNDRWTGIAREHLAKLYEAWGKPEKAASLNEQK